MNINNKSKTYKKTISTRFILLSHLTIALLCFKANSSEINTQQQEQFVTVELSQEDIESLKLGKQINEALLAIKHPNDPTSIHKITKLGWDQRYYLMIRGWLVLQLQADQSIYTGMQDQTHLADRIEFIKKAIRTIDLE
ncbi:hypothetical protein [Thalassomonas sp. M1454]|uniref:hypothetical protein n=1 Tax=Thalassomonas sp. M1454 TaxID=2594477 RepID=UPI00117D55A8|nr:hypothetical protein [Thalassomonas sp. M1454]TRX54451.1 hypothetical protein FNN08_12015 [Thalassomonas sp. M1454]